MTAREREEAPVDAVYEAVDVVGDAWSWLVLRESLLFGTRRFNELQRDLGIARATLSSRLDRLVAGEMLRREAPPTGNTVDYVPTPRGSDFLPCLAVALRWGDEWCADGGATPLLATHEACGAPFRGVLTCAECNARVDAREVEVGSIRRASSELITSKRQRAPRRDLLERVQPCSLARTLLVIGDRWSSLVVRECFLGTRRFDDFSARLGIASNILASRLQHLVDHGVLARRPYQERPLRHEYRLTPKGLALYPIPLSMLAWGERWLTSGSGGIRLTHRPCGRALTPVLSCEECARAVAPGDVAFERTDARHRMEAAR